MQPSTDGQGQGAPQYVIGGTCRQGHQLTPENAYVSKIGVRCKACRTQWGHNYNERRKRKIAAGEAALAGRAVTSDLDQPIDYYEKLPRIEMFYSPRDKCWIARFRNTTTLDGLSGRGNGSFNALIELSIAYSAVHDSPHMGGNLLILNDRPMEVPDAA